MILATLEALAAHLVSGDVRASVDPAKVNVPGVWVTVASIAPDLMSGDGHVEAYLYLIAPDTSPLGVLGVLDQLLDAVVELVDTEGDIAPTAVVLPDNTTPLPAYRVSVLLPYARTEITP